MQYTLFDLLKPEHVLVGGQAADARGAIEWLSRPLIDSGNVAAEFAEDVWKREQSFPTGLPTQPLAVAMPHADPDHVLTSAVAIGVLNAPVEFSQMGTDGSVRLPARILFLLAIKEREKQVAMIAQLMSLIQSQSLLAGLAGARHPAVALELMRKTAG